MLVSTHAQTVLVTPELLNAAPGWCPSYFVGPTAVALRAGADGLTLAQRGGQVIEGRRLGAAPGSLNYDAAAASRPVYTQSNIGRFRLTASGPLWKPPQETGDWCVQPGDVVVNKHPPIRAAFVSPATRRHAVDGNSLLVRGLRPAAATWLALCLNQRPYQQLLLAQSGILQRVGLRALANLRLASPPSELDNLATQLGTLLDEWLSADESMHRLHLETAEESGGVDRVRSNLGTGVVFKADALSNDSWIPATTLLRSEQAVLAVDFRWVPLDKLASVDHRGRLAAQPDGKRSLRLGDVGDDLFVPGTDGPINGLNIASNRLMAEPLRPGEVLVSTIGTRFRAAYVDEAVPPQTHPADGWVRLRFKETPAAWALLLMSEPVRAQAARLTVGSARQFVSPNALMSLHLPAPERETRDRWQRAVERHHSLRRALERRWNSLMTALAAAFERHHRLAPVESIASSRGRTS